MSTVSLDLPPGVGADEVRRWTAQVSASRSAAARVSAALAHGADVAPAVAGQLAAVELLWRHLIDRYGVYTSADVARLRGVNPGDRSVATRLARTHGLIGLTRGGAKLYPTFEFTADGPNPHWKNIVAPLTSAGWDDADILLWLVSPHPTLDGQEPAALIDAEPDRVIALTGIEAQGVA